MAPHARKIAANASTPKGVTAMKTNPSTRRTRSKTATTPSSFSSAGKSVATSRVEKVKVVRPRVSQPTPASLNAAHQNNLDTKAKIDAYMVKQGFWKPPMEPDVQIDVDDWKRKLNEAMADFSDCYDGEDALRKNQLTTDDLEVGVHMLMCSIVDLHLYGTVLHPSVDPTIMKGKINHEARNMGIIERLQEVEGILKLDKKMCEYVVYASVAELHKILVAAPKEIIEQRERNWLTNYKKGQTKGQGKKASQ